VAGACHDLALGVGGEGERERLEIGGGGEAVVLAAEQQGGRADLRGEGERREGGAATSSMVCSKRARIPA
jgi:hypothetical protein